MSYACPKCQSDDDLLIVVSYEAAVIDQHDDDIQIDVIGDVEWDDQSPMRCRKCAYAGVMAQFKQPEQP